MAKKQQHKMLTVRQVAERTGAAESSIRVWAGRGRFPGASVERPPVGVPYWLIPEEALDGFTMGKSGPKPKTKQRTGPKKSTKS